MSSHQERAVVAAKRAVVFAAIAFGANVLLVGLLVWRAVR